MSSGNFYIGSSFNIFKRLNTHIRQLINNKHLNPYILNSFNKYGIDNILFECIERCDKFDLINKENLYLKKLNPQLNICLTASSVMKDRKHSDKTKLKFKNRKVWNKGIPRTDSEKKLISKNRSIAYQNQTDECKKAFSEKQKINPSRYWLGKKIPKNIYDKLNGYAKLISQKIICLETGTIYNSQLAAAKDLKIKQGHISEVLNGKRNTAGGYNFKKQT
jgi:group I intron endonuclease